MVLEIGREFGAVLLECEGVLKSLGCGKKCRRKVYIQNI